MIHYIIVKFIEPNNINNYLEDIKTLFNQSLNIEGITKVDIYTNNIDLPNRHDLMIKIEMDNKDVLTSFDNSYIHKEWKEKYGHLIATKTIFDCDK